jgi:endoglucanase
MVGALLASVAAAAVTVTVAQPAAAPSAATTSYVTIPAMGAAQSSANSASSVVSVAASATPVPAAATAAAPSQVLPGVNISGGEFGKLPGVLGYQYKYPTNGDIDYFAGQGFKVIRVPFRWQRLQPVPFGPLSEPDRVSLQKVVAYANARGLTVVIDMHDYAARIVSTAAARIGTAELPAAALTDAWVKVGADYRGNDKVWVGLMNEPSGLPIADWWKVAQEVVTQIRKKGVNNKLLVPGGSWTGAYSWIKSGNATYAEQFVDPGKNYAFEVHQYFDSDSSGTHIPCSVGSASRVDAVLNWAVSRKVKLFFGEMAASSDPQCAIEYPAALTKLNSSPAVIAWTAWGGGYSWATTYMFRLNPLTADNNPTAHMLLLRKNFPK